MAALSCMYVNNNVYLVKKLINWKMVEDASIAHYLNKFNIITNQLSYVLIEFDDDIQTLIL